MANIQIPHLQPTRTSKQLIVHGEPFLMLAGELQNSSLSSAEHMREIWPKMVGANINTILGCVTWEQIEPEEGMFDFEELDAIVKDARSHGIKLVLLWFGSFKNGLSTYVPSWVKKDSKRFPRARLRRESGALGIGNVLSIFHNEAPTADARAFARLMTHLKHIDETYSTVIAVQVENETGLLEDSRDRSAAAEEQYNASVPAELVSFLTTQWDQLHGDVRQNRSRPGEGASGTWSEVFGESKSTDELFMAYHYSLYVEKVAKTGRDAYPLPLYTNVWLGGEDGDTNLPAVVTGGVAPGEYPSGGGNSSVLDIWQRFAPSLDFIAPDIYLNDYAAVCEKYRHRGQPLFVPAQRRDEYGARRIWSAFGSYQALGTSPFGIDTLEVADNPFKKHYGLLSKVSKHVLQAQCDESSIGFFFDELPSGWKFFEKETQDNEKDPSPSFTVTFGHWKLLIERSFVFGHPGPGCGMVIHQGGDKFLLIGWGFQVTFSHDAAPYTGMLSFHEKEVKDGQLKTLRVLNGDETRSGLSCVMPNDDPDYDVFPVCVTIPAKTGIAEAEVYALWD